MSQPAAAPARCVAVLLFVALASVAACGGTDSSDVGGGHGSAVAISGTVKGRPFVAKDAASVALPVSDELTNSILALIYSDTTGICEQANSTFDPNTTIFIAVLIDMTGANTPATGSYAVISPSDQNPIVTAGNSGVAEVLAQYQNDALTADGGTINIALQASNGANGTSSGSIMAMMGATTILSGKFEAPYCQPLDAYIRAALGL